MLDGLNLEERAFVAELCDDIGVTVHNKTACVICCLFGEAAALVSKLNKGKLVILTYTGVVLTECGSDVNNACTAVECNVTVAGYKPCLIVVLVLNIGEERLVLGVLKVSTLVLFNYLILQPGHGGSIAGGRSG